MLSGVILCLHEVTTNCDTQPVYLTLDTLRILVLVPNMAADFVAQDCYRSLPFGHEDLWILYYLRLYSLHLDGQARSDRLATVSCPTNAITETVCNSDHILQVERKLNSVLAASKANWTWILQEHISCPYLPWTRVMISEWF